MSISSNTLFHFVRQPQYLVDILNKDFYPRYCKENFGFKFIHFKEAYILMKCFCDIPLSQISNHTKFYGSYGVGFSKEWGIRNHINPIIYLGKDSNTYKVLNSTTRKRLDDSTKLYTKGEITEEEHYHNVFETLSIIAYVKPISGRMPRGKTYFNNVNFYNEREWRYVPLEFINHKGENQENRVFLLPTDLENLDENIQRLHDISKRDMQLTFEANDIKYIFIKDESERSFFCNLILNSNHFLEEEKKVMVSKILTIKQINEDF